jgi:hypothetical protein
MLSNTTHDARRTDEPATDHRRPPVNRVRQTDARQPGTSYAATLIDLARLLARQAATSS